MVADDSHRVSDQNLRADPSKLLPLRRIDPSHFGSRLRVFHREAINLTFDPNSRAFCVLLRVSLRAHVDAIREFISPIRELLKLQIVLFGPRGPRLDRFAPAAGASSDLEDDQEVSDALYSQELSVLICPTKEVKLGRK